jgi:hypothetical protein
MGPNEIQNSRDDVEIQGMIQFDELECLFQCSRQTACLHLGYYFVQVLFSSRHKHMASRDLNEFSTGRIMTSQVRKLNAYLYISDTEALITLRLLSSTSIARQRGSGFVLPLPGFGLPDTVAIGRELKLDDILTNTVLFIYHVE